MNPHPVILQTAQAKFPKSANKRVLVSHAWRSSDSTLDWPVANGSDGWTHVGKFATREVVQNLRDQDFSWVTLETGGTRKSPLDVRIADLI